MPVLTDLASARIKQSARILYGVTTSTPKLILSEGLDASYVVDVNIGELDPTGVVNQYIINKETGESGALTGIPGQKPEDWHLDDSLPGGVDTTLHNVPLARNNTELIYADINAPVILTRAAVEGGWQVSGFSIQQPGTHNLYPVDLGTMTIDTVIDLSIRTRLLNLAEIGELQPFGALPFGAAAVFKGSHLLRIVV